LLSRGFILKALCCEIMPLLMLALGSHWYRFAFGCLSHCPAVTLKKNSRMCDYLCPMVTYQVNKTIKDITFILSILAHDGKTQVKGHNSNDHYF
jgi:hypothetical protein